MNKPQVTLFDGKSLPAGADEDWWGGPVSLDDPEAGKNLNVPARANSQSGGAFTTVTAKPGDMVTVYEAEGTEGESDYRPAWGKVGGEGTALPPDDPAVTGPDKQTEYMKEAHRTAHGLAAERDPGTTIHGPAGGQGGLQPSEAIKKAQADDAAAKARQPAQQGKPPGREAPTR
jgi:hypothetical protein